MWPWGHLAVAYLCYVRYTRLRRDAQQTAATLAAVAVGSQLPDLIDKTFAWTVPLLPSGRSFGHSLFGIALLVAVVYKITLRYRRTALAPAFAIGMLSHSLADLGPSTIGGLLTGNLAQLQWTTYLFWPLLAPPPYSNDESFLYHVLALEPNPYMLVQFALVGIAAAVWVASGAPGYNEVTATIRTRLSARR